LAFYSQFGFKFFISK
jgi:hypothetical protein